MENTEVIALVISAVSAVIGLYVAVTGGLLTEKE